MQNELAEVCNWNSHRLAITSIAHVKTSRTRTGHNLVQPDLLQKKMGHARNASVFSQLGEIDC